jgi:hypothetical protein
MRRHLYWAGWVLSTLLCGFSHAATLHVPSEYPTLQAAINASQNGDTVLVADGIYTGAGNRNISFSGKTIILRSENGPTHCIMDCQAEAGIFAYQITECDPVIEGFTIVRCSVADSDPAILFINSNCIIRNCIFTDNAACIYGLPGTDANVINCTFYGNTGGENSGTVGMSDNIHNNGRFTVRNSIFWNNQPKEIDFDFHMCKSGYHAAMVVEFSILQSTWQDQFRLEFENCIYGQNPLFADAESGDFHLKSQMGRWDEFNKMWVKDEVTSPGIDAGHPDDNYSNELWPHGKRINVGAYGNTPQASLSVVSRGNPADADGDDRVNQQDFAAFAAQWQSGKTPVRSDMNRDGNVDLADFFIFAQDWMTQNIDSILTVADAVLVDEPISVSFSGMPGNAADWLGICQKGASIEPWAGAMLQWVYTDGTQTGTAGMIEGTVLFSSLSDPGDYEVRLFSDGTYDIRDRAFFTVAGGSE